MAQANLEQFEIRESDRTWQGGSVSPDQVQTLFEKLKHASQEGQSEERALLRDHLVVLHGALVEHCARNFSTSNEPVEDLVQEGYVGLIKAVDRYNPQQGVRFSTYACHLINGEIRHYLRDLGKLIHEPGWHFELRTRIAKTHEVLIQQLGREPEPKEIARALNVDLKTVQEVLKNQQTLSVEYLDQSTNENDDESPGWEYKAGQHDARNERQVEHEMILGEVFPHLQEVEKKALMMHFFQERSKTEVARELGISINHASYILKRGLDTLRRMIEAGEEIKVPPSPEARARAAFLLEQTQKAAGLSHPGITDVEHYVPPSALIPGMLPFADIVELLDTRLNENKDEESNFSLLWLQLTKWEDVVSEFDPALRREASNAMQVLTRKCCRATDYASMLTSPEWPGLHFVLYLPNTGPSGTRVGRRWQERCKDPSFWPDEPAILKKMCKTLQTRYAFAMHPREGESAVELFRNLGQSLK